MFSAVVYVTERPAMKMIDQRLRVRIIRIGEAILVKSLYTTTKFANVILRTIALKLEIENELIFTKNLRETISKTLFHDVLSDWLTHVVCIVGIIEPESLSVLAIFP